MYQSIGYDKKNNIMHVWDERIVGVGTATFNANASNVIMQVGSTAGSKIVRQTKNLTKDNTILFTILYLQY